LCGIPEDWNLRPALRGTQQIADLQRSKVHFENFPCSLGLLPKRLGIPQAE
jgi:hypothetical protein